MNRLRPRWCGCTSPSEWCASRGICFETVAVRRIRGAVLDVLEAELREAVRDAVAALPDRLRWAVMGHFGDGREMKSLAEDLGVTPSRVSQLSVRPSRSCGWGSRHGSTPVGRRSLGPPVVPPVPVGTRTWPPWPNARRWVRTTGVRDPTAA
jgi:hypothetical protein